MSYPPRRHLLSDLRAESRYRDGLGEMRAPVIDGVVDDDGAMRLGVLATLQDVTGAVVALPAVQPDWIATSSLSINVLAPPKGDAVVARCRCTRVGSKSAVVECSIHTIVDGHMAEPPSAIGLMNFARIPGSASVAQPSYSDSTGWASVGGRELDLGRVDERLGFRNGESGSEVDAADYVRNSFGTVNGGVQCALACAEAERAAGDSALATDLQFHYLSQVGDGPLVAAGTVVRHDGRSTLVRIRLHDASTDSLVALATVHCS